MTINENGVSREMTADEIERFNSTIIKEDTSQIDEMEAYDLVKN